MQHCIVLHFAQFCTMHNFQIYLEHLWADFQSCSDDDGRDELILIAVMMTTEMVSPSFKGFSVNFGLVLVFLTSTVPGALSSLSPLSQMQLNMIYLIANMNLWSIQWMSYKFWILINSGTFWSFWPLTQPLSCLPTLMWNSTDLDLFQTSGGGQHFVFIPRFTVQEKEVKPFFGHLFQFSICSFYGF